MEQFVLIDGNSLLHRAFHAIPPLTTPSGEPMNAVFGFASMFINLIQKLKPDYMAVVFDAAGKTFRHEVFPDYKATRKKAPQELYDQLPRVKELVDAFGIPRFEESGYEADDILGSIAEQSKKNSGLEVVVVTGDLDTLQLIDDNVSVATPYKGFQEIQTYTRETVQEKFGIRPDQVVDFKALRGDASDNIPGVPGIGPKNAQNLLTQFGSLQGIYEHLDQVPTSLGKKLSEGKQLAFLSQNLSRIRVEFPVAFQLEKCHLSDVSGNVAVRNIFEKFHFFSLLKRLRISNSPPIIQQSLFS